MAVNVVACAAALATLDVIEQEGLVENAAARGLQMLSGLRAITAGRREVGDVRGIGLMLALEFVKPDEGDGRVPNPDAVKRVIGEAADRRLSTALRGIVRPGDPNHSAARYQR